MTRPASSPSNSHPFYLPRSHPGVLTAPRQSPARRGLRSAPTTDARTFEALPSRPRDAGRRERHKSASAPASREGGKLSSSLGYRACLRRTSASHLSALASPPRSSAERGDLSAERRTCAQAFNERHPCLTATDEGGRRQRVCSTTSASLRRLVGSVLGPFIGGGFWVGGGKFGRQVSPLRADPIDSGNFGGLWR
ncbi:uncharacterized protein SCHCODRAFT_02108506 [Schizophyllum commune H4-8]|uniref:uncharacterized protein n=1 Tax=Schizophyllum commune (strain H4-8 / FGSC 9210) TaxID=578458 RepID=UPI00215E12BC|nr:uncharacterized protein SCHCODRAFT_02108506 [Schizophyllum commune H4-8]KAI5885926.1 hypothetical protein SCHCODRAFT_02108506 [Schizophyllum commune H4-8]